VLEVYWMVTSKKLNVMYFLPDMLHHFITTQTRNQTGSLVGLTSCLPWLSRAEYSTFVCNSTILCFADEPLSRHALVYPPIFPRVQMEYNRTR